MLGESVCQPPRADKHKASQSSPPAWEESLFQLGQVGRGQDNGEGRGKIHYGQDTCSSRGSKASQEREGEPEGTEIPKKPSDTSTWGKITPGIPS